MSNQASDEMLQLLAAGSPQLAPRIGGVAGYDAERGLLVDYPGNSLGPLPARSIVRFDARALEEAVRERRAVLLLFEGGDPQRPIVLGLVEPVNPTPLLDLIIEPTPENPEEAQPPREAKLDGKRVVLEAEDEIELRCGKSSITLRRNGRVVIRGAYVETHAEGVNRIKGGSVAIN